MDNFCDRLSSLSLPLSILLTYLLMSLSSQYMGSDVIYRLLSLHTDLSLLARHPWQVATYAWVHPSIGYLLPNLLLLLFITQLSDGAGVKALIIWRDFLLGSLICALIFVVENHHTTALLQGASAGITALLATTLYRWIRGRHQESIRRRLLLFTLLLTVIIIIDFVTHSERNTMGLYAHYSGFIVGLTIIIVTQMKSIRLERYYRDAQSKDRVRYQIHQKIKASGYASLSKEEKRFISERKESD